jgi:hypothetical protein
MWFAVGSAAYHMALGSSCMVFLACVQHAALGSCSEGLHGELRGGPVCAAVATACGSYRL